MHVKGLRPLNGVLRQLGVELFEDGLRKARADVAHRLVVLARGVVAREQEGAVHARALALAVVGADDDEVERVADAGEVVLFDLEPVAAALAGLVAGFRRVEHLDHQAFAGRSDGVVEKRLDLFEVRGVAVLGKGEFAFDGVEGGLEEVAAFAEGLFYDSL